MNAKQLIECHINVNRLAAKKETPEIVAALWQKVETELNFAEKINVLTSEEIAELRGKLDAIEF